MTLRYNGELPQVRNKNSRRKYVDRTDAQLLRKQTLQVRAQNKTSAMAAKIA